jgi:hypothetical protein
VLIGSIGGLMYLYLTGSRRVQQRAGELPSSAPTAPRSSAAPLTTLSDAGASTDGSAAISDPTGMLFMLVLIVTVAAWIHLYPLASTQPLQHVEDDPPEN